MVTDRHTRQPGVAVAAAAPTMGAMSENTPVVDRDALFAEGVDLRSQGITAQRAGDWHRASDLFTEAERRFHRAALGAQVAWTMLHQGQVQERIGEAVEAIALFTGAEAMLRFHGDRSGIPLCFRRRGDVLRRQKRYDAALAQYCEGEAIYRTFHDPLGMVGILVGKGFAYLGQGRRIEAHAAVAESLWKLQQQPPSHGADIFLAHALAARVLGLAGDADGARANLAQAAQLARLGSLHEDHTDPDVEAELALLPAG
jgi:tetratricopeptide (TPR) repeat protein